MDHFDLIINFFRRWWFEATQLKRDTHREVQKEVPTCLLPSQHAGKDARTLAQVAVCFSQLGEGTERQVLISKECKNLLWQHNTLPPTTTDCLIIQLKETHRKVISCKTYVRKLAMNIPHLQQKTDELMARGPTVHTYTYLPQTCNYWKSVTTIKS